MSGQSADQWLGLACAAVGNKLAVNDRDSGGLRGSARTGEAFTDAKRQHGPVGAPMANAGEVR
ncbi:hypothetical protein JOD54_006263 [Actinokineospora baliensis]|nr:hypothetical protein [Actinokineospora baliensis]